VLSSQEEADDLIGIASTADPSAIVCSIDKDLLQLPGKHYDFVKKEETAVSPKEAVVNFYSQVLAGDSVDNVPGVTGIGPVRARKILEGASSPVECWQRTLDIYQDVYKEYGFVYANEAARLVFVRRHVNQVWSPPEIEATQAAPQRKTKASRR
jgi:5'-3' exonuclease